MRMTAAEAPDATLARRAELQQATTMDSLAVAAPLYDEPRLAMTWQAMGVDGAAGGTVPQFFRDRGVNLAAPMDVNDPESAGAPAEPASGKPAAAQVRRGAAPAAGGSRLERADGRWAGDRPG